MRRRDVYKRQIRQSFRPGEITAEEANKVGYELAMRFTKGKHAFVVATHTDRQHIHKMCIRDRNKQVYVYNYVTESTFDAYLYVRHEVA